MKLLDCTLRDGGYYTNWDFNTQMVRDLITSLDLSKIDIIELGYKSPVKGGKYRKCNDRFIWEILEHKLPVNSELAFMIDAKDFIKGDVVDYSLIDDVIHNKNESPWREVIRLENENENEWLQQARSFVLSCPRESNQLINGH